MNKNFFFLFLSVFLASCSNTIAPPTLVFTETKAPTATLVFTATSQPVPTETPDPNRPLDATGADVKGNYIKMITENGKSFTYIWTVEKDAAGNTLFEGWATPKTIDRGIPIGDGSVPGRQDFGFIQVFVADGALGGNMMPQLFHKNNAPSQDTEVNISGMALTSLEKRLLHVKSQPHGADKYNVDQSIMDGTAKLDFYTDSPENSQIWHISPDHGAKVILMKWEAMAGAHENTDASVGTKIYFRSRILGIDADGQLITQLAILEPLNTLTAYQYNEIIFMQVAGIVDGPDQTAPDKSDTLFDWLAFLDTQYFTKGFEHG